MQKHISPKIPPRLDASEHAATALHFIARFGWLRATELGRFVYPNDKHGRKYAEKLLRKLVQLRYVLPRKLPGVGAGTAYVVATRGASWLNANVVGSNERNAHLQEDDYFRDGTNWGRTNKDGIWSPPLSWEHDLLSTGVLSLFWQQGAVDVVSERELLRMVPNVKDNKHADGLAVTKDQHGRLQSKRPPNALLARGWIQVQAVVGAAGCQRWGSREEMSACLVVGRRVMTSRRYA